MDDKVPIGMDDKVKQFLSSIIRLLRQVVCAVTLIASLITEAIKCSGQKTKEIITHSVPSQTPSRSRREESAPWSVGRSAASR